MPFGFRRNDPAGETQPGLSPSSEEKAKAWRTLIILYVVMFGVMVLNGYLLWKYGQRREPEKPLPVQTNSLHTLTTTNRSSTNHLRAVSSAPIPTTQASAFKGTKVKRPVPKPSQ